MRSGGEDDVSNPLEQCASDHSSHIVGKRQSFFPSNRTSAAAATARHQATFVGVPVQVFPSQACPRLQRIQIAPEGAFQSPFSIDASFGGGDTDGT